MQSHDSQSDDDELSRLPDQQIILNDTPPTTEPETEPEPFTQTLPTNSPVLPTNPPTLPTNSPTLHNPQTILKRKDETNTSMAQQSRRTRYMVDRAKGDKYQNFLRSYQRRERQKKSRKTYQDPVESATLKSCTAKYVIAPAYMEPLWDGYDLEKETETYIPTIHDPFILDYINNLEPCRTRKTHDNKEENHEECSPDAGNSEPNHDEDSHNDSDDHKEVKNVVKNPLPTNEHKVPSIDESKDPTEHETSMQDNQVKVLRMEAGRVGGQRRRLAT